MRTLHALLAASLVASCGASPVPRREGEEDEVRRLNPRPLLGLLSPAARKRSRTHGMSAKWPSVPSRKRGASLERRVKYFGERPMYGDRDVPALKDAKFEPHVLYFKLTAFERVPGYEGKEREFEEVNFMRAADHNLHAQTDHDNEEEDIEYADPMPLPEMKSEKHAGFVQPIQSVGSDLMPKGEPMVGPRLLHQFVGLRPKTQEEIQEQLDLFDRNSMTALDQKQRNRIKEGGNVKVYQDLPFRQRQDGKIEYLFKMTMPTYLCDFEGWGSELHTDGSTPLRKSKKYTEIEVIATYDRLEDLHKNIMRKEKGEPAVGGRPGKKSGVDLLHPLLPDQRVSSTFQACRHRRRRHGQHGHDHRQPRRRRPATSTVD